MSDQLVWIIASATWLILFVFLAVRLRLFSSEVGGRLPLLFGALLVQFSFVWQTVKMGSEYSVWFIDSVYPILEMTQFGLTGVGMLLVTIGFLFYADYWQTRGDSLREREAKLSIVENLRQDSRQPYQLLDMVNIATREIVFHYQGCAGVVFLLNRARREFVLATSVGLSKREMAALEHYPYARNAVSQSVELGDPIIAGSLELVDKSGNEIESDYCSNLILPLVSGTDRVGVLLLLSPEKRRFGNDDIKDLVPVTEWLAEKIKSARLTRELSSARNRSEQSVVESNSLTTRLVSTITALLGADPATGFTQSMVGMADAESVHLVALRHGALTIIGGSEPLVDISENYRTALIEAIGRGKPLIVNQEAASESGSSEIASSSLVLPLTLTQSTEALLLRRSGTAFKVNEEELRKFDLFTKLARAVLKQAGSQKLDITRRKGFDAVLKLLRSDSGPIRFEDDPGYFVEILAEALPRGTIGLTFERSDRGEFAAVSTLRGNSEAVGDIKINSVDDEFGTALFGNEPLFIYGRSEVAAKIESLNQNSLNGMQRLVGERGFPLFMATCPLGGALENSGAALILIYDMDDSQRGEWEQMLTLAVSLYSLRLMLNRNLSDSEPLSGSGYVGPDLINDMNNHLAAIIGSAELIAQHDQLTPNVSSQIVNIIDEAEAAAIKLRNNRSNENDDIDISLLPVIETAMHEVIGSVLERLHISGLLHMIAGRPREITVEIDPDAVCDLSSDQLEELIGSALDRFGVWTPDEDIISINSYPKQGAVYIDISRHRRNFPPVERVEGHGKYQTAIEASVLRPDDLYLKLADKAGFALAIDTEDARPAYISFRRLLGTKSGEGSKTNSKVRLLAIDDHEVILDLVTAMGQSQGYLVDTANNGEDGLALALEQEYDLILTDLAMPEISGLEVARRIHAVHPAQPIILVTGWDARLNQEQLRSLGIVQILHKPFRIEQLTDIIDSLIKARQKA